VTYLQGRNIVTITVHYLFIMFNERNNVVRFSPSWKHWNVCTVKANSHIIFCYSTCLIFLSDMCSSLSSHSIHIYTSVFQSVLHCSPPTEKIPLQLLYQTPQSSGRISSRAGSQSWWSTNPIAVFFSLNSEAVNQSMPQKLPCPLNSLYTHHFYDWRSDFTYLYCRN